MPECDICGQSLASNRLAFPAHARKHKNEFEKLVGRRPDSYAEVRALYNEGEIPDDVDGVIGGHATLDEFQQGGRE